jgi:hypothetical protein
MTGDQREALMDEIERKSDEVQRLIHALLKEIEQNPRETGKQERENDSKDTYAQRYLALVKRQRKIADQMALATAAIYSWDNKTQS